MDKLLAHQKFDRLISWSEHPNDGFSHYSGTATYRGTLEVPPNALASPQMDLMLDLGNVQVRWRG